MTNLDNQKLHTQNDVFVAYKKEGETPLECLNRLKDEGFLPFNDKFTYAGRLDPVAEGLMIFLRGEAIKDKEHFLGLEKEYKVEVLLGAVTDTGDILGLLNSVSNNEVVFDIKNIGNICESFIGDLEVPYPWFSSKTVNGKPLHMWFREFDSEEDVENEECEFGKKTTNESKDSFVRPTTKLSIKDIEFIDLSFITANELHNNVIKRIKKIKGDFRQNEIIQEWDKVSVNNSSSNTKKNTKKHSGDSTQGIEFPLIKIKVRCGSGSYMRTLAELIGEKLNVPALAYSIKRISIGEYKI
ncbi:MAG: hypothetical protein WCQ00_03225 [bacterium]